MWSPIVLCLLVGVTLASNPGWKTGSEYLYRINGRTFANLDAISQQQSGLLFKAKLKLQPQSNGNLRGLILKPQYDDVHAELPDGWQTRIPNEQLNWKDLKMTNQPFEVEMKSGRIIGLIVSKDCLNWEVNFIKSIMSQFQLSTNGDELIDHPINTLLENEDGDNDAVYFTMEDTVSGETETMYLIRPVPDYLLQRRCNECDHDLTANEAHLINLAKDGNVIEILKHKNFTNNNELPAYFYGFGKLVWGEPATSQMGNFLVRESSSRIILTGSLQEFAIHNSVTVNKIFVSLTLSDNDKGSVVSEVNATLKAVTSQSQIIGKVPKAVNVGNLVYSYEKPFTYSPKATWKSSSSGHTNNWSNNNDDNDERNNIRHPRSLNYMEQYSSEYESNEDNQNNYMNKKPTLREAPGSPLLPYTVGYEGMSVKNKVNVVQVVQKLAREIGQKMQNPERKHHQQLLGQFQTMISLIRIMDFNEIQQAAKYLYTNEYEGLQRAIWAAYRDAVSQSGTGPALLCISDWFKTNKVEYEEASQLAATMTSTARQPTLEYMKALFELAKSHQVQKQWPLNNTILLGYTDLIRRVYVDEQMSRYGFPTNSFGSFDSDEGEQFMKQEVIPYFSRQLKEAVQNEDTHKIHAYIRILGNTGSYDFLKEFEPYLEGRQQVSQFQRVLMILAMEKLVETHPQTAQAVLFRVYQNPGEYREVRIAAVYQLMRTLPPADMLQVMAHYTNFDDDDYVNAAVISSIEYASDLKGYQYIEFREAAKAAQPLLAKDKSYGFRHGANHLRTYVSDELEKMSTVANQMFGSDDTATPKGIRYAIKEYMGKIKRRTLNVLALVSSMDVLFQVGQEQTSQYLKFEKQQKEKSHEQEQNPWSSQNIAKLLNIQSEDTEQFEAFFFTELNHQYYMAGFDNTTIEELPEAIRAWEKEFKEEKQMNMYKLSSAEMAVAFPTALGLPFLFTYDIPMFAKVQGKLSAQASPQFYKNGKLSTPDQIDIKADVKVTISSKVQSRLSFTAPFNHKHYTAGFDRHWEVNVPVSVEAQLDVKNGNAEFEIEFKADRETSLLHYGTIPYTYKIDITNFEPISQTQGVKVIKQNDLQSYENTFGKQATGMAFRLEMKHRRRFFDTISLGRMIKEQRYIDSLRSIWDDNSIQYGYINIYFRPEESANRKAKLSLSYESKYRSQPDSDSASEWILNENAEPAQRQRGLMKKVAAGIKNVDVHSVDLSIEFKGQKTAKYVITGAVAKSNVDPKSRCMVSYKRKGDEPHELHLVVKSYIPNTNALDAQLAIQNEPMASNEIKIKFGNSKESLSKLDIQIEHRRSEERKHFLKQLPKYKQCKDEMRTDNKQLSACANITQEAGLLDHVSMKVLHENMDTYLVDSVESIFEALRFLLIPQLETAYQNQSLNENELKIQALFHPDLQAVNVSVKTQEQENIFSNIPVGELSKEIFVVHPVFHLRSRLASYALELDTYRPFCTVDKTHVNTFSNSTFPANIAKHWTLMLQYLYGNTHQQHKSIAEQLKSQPENYVVLVRESPEASNKKDVKIVVSTPETDFEIIEIELTPNQQKSQSEAHGKVSVNGQEVRVSDKESYDVEDGFIQIYCLPNGEVKVEVSNAFYIIYDGNLAKLSALNGKFRNRMVGLCGQFTEQESDDFLTPQACIARDPEDFVKSLEVEGQNGKQVRDAFTGKSNKCVAKDIPNFINLITSTDYRGSLQKPQPGKSTRCTYFQSRYKEENGEICFTIHPQPKCTSNCQSKRQLTKDVPVHCVQHGNVAQLWKKQIDNGGNPNLNGELQHKTMSFSVPETCLP